MLVKLDHFPNFRDENQKCFKPPSMGVSKIWENPQIIHFNMGFHYNPSILGKTPLFLDWHPIYPPRKESRGMPTRIIRWRDTNLKQCEKNTVLKTLKIKITSNMLMQPPSPPMYLHIIYIYILCRVYIYMHLNNPPELPNGDPSPFGWVDSLRGVPMYLSLFTCPGFGFPTLVGAKLLKVPKGLKVEHFF